MPDFPLVGINCGTSNAKGALPLECKGRSFLCSQLERRHASGSVAWDLYPIFDLILVLLHSTGIRRGCSSLRRVSYNELISVCFTQPGYGEVVPPFEEFLITN